MSDSMLTLERPAGPFAIAPSLTLEDFVPSYMEQFNLTRAQAQLLVIFDAAHGVIGVA